jgi:hypothetical protein
LQDDAVQELIFSNAGRLHYEQLMISCTFSGAAERCVLWGTRGQR